MASASGETPTGAPPEPSPAAPWMLLATAVLWGGAGLLIKGTPLAGEQLAFWRSLSAAAAYQLVLLSRGRRPSWRNLKDASLGGAGFGLSIALQFVAYKSTTLVSANVIISIQPLLLGVVARRYFGVRHGRRAFAATLAAVGGTAIVVVGSTSSGAFSFHGDLAALASTLVGCLYPVGIKRTRTARPELGPLEYQASAMWTAALVCLPVAALTRGGLAPPGAATWPWIAAIVVVGGTGHLIFTAAQRHVSVMSSSTITLAQILVVAVGAALAFHQRITAEQVVGMVIVAVSVGWWVASSE